MSIFIIKNIEGTRSDSTDISRVIGNYLGLSRSGSTLSISNNLNVGGIILTTSGGTPAILNYYEETTFDIILAGPWTTQNLTLRITKVGKNVTLSSTAGIAGITSTASSVISSSPVLPQRFRPSEVFVQVITVVSGTQTSGQLSINSGGGITILTESGSPFPNSTLVGFNPFSVSYTST